MSIELFKISYCYDVQLAYDQVDEGRIGVSSWGGGGWNGIVHTRRYPQLPMTLNVRRGLRWGYRSTVGGLELATGSRIKAGVTD